MELKLSTLTLLPRRPILIPYSALDPVIKVSPDVLLGFTFGIRLGLDVECGTGLLVTVQ